MRISRLQSKYPWSANRKSGTHYTRDQQLSLSMVYVGIYKYFYHYVYSAND